MQCPHCQATLAEKDRFFDGDAQNAALYEQAIRRCEALGGIAVELDYTPLRETAELLYGGAFVVERLAAIEPFFTAHEAARRISQPDGRPLRTLPG